MEYCGILILAYFNKKKYVKLNIIKGYKQQAKIFFILFVITFIIYIF